MNRIARNALTLAAAAAVTLAAAPARADHEEHERGRDCDRHATPAVAYAPAPAPAPVYVPVHAPAPVVVYAPAPAPAPDHRRAGWEAHRRMDELRAEYRELDAARGRFYATWHGNAWRRDRFEAWYASRHAELDRRSAELERWRDHERGERWAYGR
ncbi:MAG: hypothetical protein ACJ79R_23255 [Anaeromyxobacteraceae bacterium]